jgi:protein-disulfide isomerase
VAVPATPARIEPPTSKANPPTPAVIAPPPHASFGAEPPTPVVTKPPPVVSAKAEPSTPPQPTTPSKTQATAPAPAPPRPQVSLAEYVNPFCPHCRATHARLLNVIRTTKAQVRIHRVYVWSSSTPPLWAHACVCAASLGKEDAFFEALLLAPRETPEAIWDAARRAGIDPHALHACVQRGQATARLHEIARQMDAGRLQRLPTIDVGRRRLQGTQSEPELRAAIDAAMRDPPRLRR